MMKLFIVLIGLFIYLGADAQVIDDDNGKTYYYYDTLTHRKVKEIFHHKQVIKVMPDPKNYGQYIDTMLHLKNGPYTRYYENGDLECSGYYINEKKDSLWKFYDHKGSILRTERWRKGQLQN